MRIMILLFALLIASQAHAQAWKYDKSIDKLTDELLYSSADNWNIRDNLSLKYNEFYNDFYFKFTCIFAKKLIFTIGILVHKSEFSYRKSSLEKYSGPVDLAFRVDKYPPKYYSINPDNTPEIFTFYDIKEVMPLVQDMLKGQKIYVRVTPGLDPDSPDYSYFFADQELSLEKSAVQIKKVFSDCNQPLP